MCFESSQKELNKTIYCQICIFTVETAIYGRVIPLKVSRPFHHPVMKTAADKFEANLNDIVFKGPILPIYMNVTGEPLSTNDSLSVKHIVKPVQWIKTIQSMKANNIDTFYEISPKTTLAAFIKNVAERKVKIIDV